MIKSPRVIHISNMHGIYNAKMQQVVANSSQLQATGISTPTASNSIPSRPFYAAGTGIKNSSRSSGIIGNICADCSMQLGHILHKHA